VETQEPEVAAVVVAHSYVGPAPTLEMTEPARAEVSAADDALMMLRHRLLSS
jgi:hypothetical protein